MPFDQLHRREFITLLGGAAATWPLAARAQQAERIRRLGVLMSTSAGNVDRDANITAFRDALGGFGWVVRRVRLGRWQKSSY
jgi:putative tryptophan/tyrosine transport system substrate-binding protein